MNNVKQISSAARYLADPANRERRERPAILAPLTRTTYISPALRWYVVAVLIVAAAVIGTLLLILLLR